MKLLREYVRELLLNEKNNITIEPDPRLLAEEMKIETVGDLKKMIKLAVKKKKMEQGKGAAKAAAKSTLWDEVLGKIPGAMAAKNAADVVKAMYTLDDKARTGTALDHLDVDDDIATIVDDPIENKFLNAVIAKIETMDDNKPLSNLNMTAALSNYISQEFNKRTVTGFKQK